MSEENKKKSEEALERIQAKTAEGITPFKEDNSSSDKYSAITDNKEVASKFVEVTDEVKVFPLDGEIKSALRSGTCTKDEAMKFLSKSAHRVLVNDIVLGLVFRNRELIEFLDKERPNVRESMEERMGYFHCKGAGKDNFCDRPNIEMKDYVLGAVTGRMCGKNSMVILRKVAELDGYLEEFDKANSLPKVYDFEGRVMDEKALAEYRKVKASSEKSKTNTVSQKLDDPYSL